MNIRQIDEINLLAGKITLNVLFDMPEQTAALAWHPENPLPA